MDPQTLKSSIVKFIAIHFDLYWVIFCGEWCYDYDPKMTKQVMTLLFDQIVDGEIDFLDVQNFFWTTYNTESFFFDKLRICEAIGDERLPNSLLMDIWHYVLLREFEEGCLYYMKEISFDLLTLSLDRLNGSEIIKNEVLRQQRELAEWTENGLLEQFQFYDFNEFLFDEFDNVQPPMAEAGVNANVEWEEEENWE